MADHSSACFRVVPEYRRPDVAETPGPQTGTYRPRFAACDNRHVPKKPQSPEAAMLQELLELAGISRDAVLQRAEEEMRQQTYVGGKRVVKQKLPRLPKSAATTIHRVKVSLYGAKPPIWRRLEVPSAMTLDLLHEVLQIAFDWDGFHLHQFETVCGEFSDPQRSDDSWSESGDEAAAALAQVAGTEAAKVVYIYDFGDDWRHDIVVEKIAPAEPGIAYPRCTGGKCIAPEEDSGGIWAANAARTGAEAFDATAVTTALADLATVIITAP
jgi:hypothetical protein